jgi:hypothetical protein
MVWLFEAGTLKAPLKVWGLIMAFIIEAYQFGPGRARQGPSYRNIENY